MNDAFDEDCMLCDVRHKNRQGGRGRQWRERRVKVECLEEKGSERGRVK